VTLAANDGTGNVAKTVLSCSYDSEYTLPLNTFERTGYTFMGWSTGVYNPVSYGNGASFINLTAGSNAKLTLYAKWQANSGTVVFDGNGADGGDMTNDAMAVTYGVYKSLPANSFTRTGYTFAGWNTRVDNLGSNYADKATVSSIPTTPNATVTMYAKWSANMYSVAFHGNNGTNMQTVQYLYYGTLTTLNGNGFSKTGYDFVGWASSPDATTAEYTNRQQVLNLTAEQGGRIDLYAVWAPRQYTVAFTPNGGTGSMTQILSCTYGSELTLPACTYTRSGYTFAGWATSAYGAILYEDADTVSNLTASANARVTLYARWTKNA